MADSVYLSQPEITIAGQDLTGQCSAFSAELGYLTSPSTVFGNTGERQSKTLQTVSGTITFYVSYGATEVEGVIAGEVGQGDTTIVVKAATGAISASNPEWTISNTMIATYPITYTVGELQVMEVSFSTGEWVRDVTP
jgi:hypothetical protein